MPRAPTTAPRPPPPLAAPPKHTPTGTEFWSIINGLPGKDGNDWTIQQVWQVVYPVYELINTGVFSWLSPILTQDVKYIWQLISPGGRMYYGP